MASLCSMRIRNKTDFPLEIQLAQVSTLYWDLKNPNGVFYRQTGAPHFTIKAIITTAAGERSKEAENFSSAGWYAGYNHDLEIHYEDGNWMIKDLKYSRLYMNL